MAQAHDLARALNVAARSPQFSYQKARAAARGDANVDWASTKTRNAEFNPDVDGCETFVMRDGSVCAWQPARQAYAVQP